MNKTTVVAFLLLFNSGIVAASSLSDSINRIESDWAISYYLKTPEQQKTDYPRLLQRVRTIGQRHPHAAEPKIWQAILLSANAEFEPALTALESLDAAKSLLEEAIKTQPDALEGAAYVTLGTLYYMVPGWPISFGDKDKAEQLLKKALSINPKGIDANYFYGDYLLTQDKFPDAVKYFTAAINAPTRKEQMLADLRLQETASMALAKARHNMNEGKSKFLSLFSTHNY